MFLLLVLINMFFLFFSDANLGLSFGPCYYHYRVISVPFSDRQNCTVTLPVLPVSVRLNFALPLFTGVPLFWFHLRCWIEAVVLVKRETGCQKARIELEYHTLRNVVLQRCRMSVRKVCAIASSESIELPR